MAKIQTRYVCQECGMAVPKWMGRCPSCGSWDALVEERLAGYPSSAPDSGGVPVSITAVATSAEQRYQSGLQELDRVLGGGIIPGSLVLLGGPPGIGKSTLLVQLAHHIAEDYGDMLYVSSEESLGQVRLRASRLNCLSPRLWVISESNLEVIEDHITRLCPVVVVIDSIQTVYLPRLTAAPGSVAQVRESAGELLRLAKERGTAMVLVGHITKEGFLAGPRVLEHLVDAVLYFEGDHHSLFRVVRATKNRFGSTDEIGVFTMGETGLEEVHNPSLLFMEQRPVGVPGSVVVPAIEGTRPVLVEVQALVSPTTFGNPRRLATGLDLGRALMIIAILEKRAGLNLGAHDIYLNVAGGLQITEPAADLGMGMAIASSFFNKPMDTQTTAVGEIGLTGEIRAINHLEKRVTEAAQFGLNTCLVPAVSLASYRDRTTPGAVLRGVQTIDQALSLCFGRSGKVEDS